MEVTEVKAMEITARPVVGFCEGGQEPGFLKTGSSLAGWTGVAASMKTAEHGAMYRRHWLSACGVRVAPLGSNMTECGAVTHPKLH